MNRVVVCTSTVTLALLTTFLIAATPLSTAFTFQGQLKQSGSLVDDTSPGCDFEFSLWDDPSAGLQLGSTQSLVGVPVTDGAFTVELNGGGEFGPNAFNGDERHLKIAVVCPSGGTLQPLSPRQKLTAVPYALALPGMRTRPSGEAQLTKPIHWVRDWSKPLLAPPGTYDVAWKKNYSTTAAVLRASVRVEAGKMTSIKVGASNPK